MGGNIELDQKVSRREVLNWMGKRAGETAFLVGINTVAFGITGYLYGKTQKIADEEAKVSLDKSEISQREGEVNLEGNPTLQTKFFARDIIHTSTVLTDYAGNNDLVLAITGALAGNVVISHLLKNHSDRIDKSVGSLSAFSARTVDIVSTLAFAKYFSDPRFQEYGLDTYFGEGNPMLGKHPSERKVALIGAITAVLIGFAGWKHPSFGRNYIGAVPFISNYNYRGAHVIKSSLEIGDQVKELIRIGKDKDYIINFLQSIHSVNDIASTESSNSDAKASSVRAGTPGVEPQR